MNSRVHPKYKTKYRVTNGSKYDQALVKRGNITLWITPEAIKGRTAKPTGRRGAPHKYSNLAIEAALTLRLLFQLPLRQAEGFLRSLLELKGRGFCPSCTGRRMAAIAAHLTDNVLPDQPLRQWVLSLPWSLRIHLACNPTLTRDVGRAFLRAVFASYTRRARLAGHLEPLTPASPLSHPPKAHPGAINFTQRFGSSLALNIPTQSIAARVGPLPDTESHTQSLICPGIVPTTCNPPVQYGPYGMARKPSFDISSTWRLM